MKYHGVIPFILVSNTEWSDNKKEKQFKNYFLALHEGQT